MNPYLVDTPCVVSFSGGRTSGRLLWEVVQAYGGALPPGVAVVFNNTGKERPETLDFVERCSQRWGVDVVWLEYRYESPVPCPTRYADWAELDDSVGGERTKRWDRWYEQITPIRREHERRHKIEVARRKKLTRKERKGLPRLSKGVGRHAFVVVDYRTASRHGEPLEEVIAARNMLPNVMARFCTVECKIRTTDRYLSRLGWTRWTNAIGFRADEPQRVAKLKVTNRHAREEPAVPLFKAGVTKADVGSFWASQPFDLELEDHEGNCSLCFLKGMGKVKRIMRDRPGDADWWIRMEASAVRRGLARNKSVAFFRKDRPRYSKLLELATAPGLFDSFDPDADDELSIACHCTD